jgi:CHAD domain-containing protein
VRRVYRSGRDAFAKARKEPTPERLHEWRKQTKYLWHQLQVLEPIWPARLATLAERAHQLSDLLGEDHDLAVLRQWLRRRRARGETQAHRAIEKLIERRRGRVQAKARSLGVKVYGDRPRAFVECLGRHWHEWRSK